MRVSSPLGPGDCRAGPHGQADAAGLREGLRGAGQDGCGGRGGDLRSSNPADDALRRDQDTGAASDADAAQDPRSAGAPAHQQINALRGHLTEYGIVSAQGAGGVRLAIEALHEAQESLPVLARFALHGLVSQLRSIEAEIEKIEAEILKWHRSNEASRRLATIPGIGPITASAIAASVPDASLFRSGRQFAAWLGLTPKSHSSGGTERQLGISKQGDGYLRRLLFIGATAVLRFARQSNASRAWAARLLERKRPKVVAVALANKTARIAWALVARGTPYTAPTA